MVKSLDGFIVIYVIISSIWVVFCLGVVMLLKKGDLVYVVVIKSGSMLMVLMVGICFEGLFGCGKVLVLMFMLLFVNGMSSIV